MSKPNGRPCSHGALSFHNESKPSWPGWLRTWHSQRRLLEIQPQIHRMVKMPHVNKPSVRRLIEFAVTEESIETQLASWIRELVQSNSSGIFLQSRMNVANP